MGQLRSWLLLSTSLYRTDFCKLTKNGGMNCAGLKRMLGLHYDDLRDLCVSLAKSRCVQWTEYRFISRVQCLNLEGKRYGKRIGRWEDAIKMNVGLM
jgi:hypothetical protein